MTRLFNDAADFTDQSIDGFVAAHGRWVRRVPGGVARNTSTPPGRVAVIIGGGSGHYPAFAGLVGQGLADGAVMGNVFASPSAAQVVSVATAAQHGGGVLLTYGNYAGDVLNFSQAEERLIGQGVPCRSLPVTDDIYSAPPTDRGKRRGVAGDLVVFKIAAAAAAEGRSLDEVAEVAARANDRTRTIGVAFTGCTLPGAAAPLFTVPTGRMAVGLGIHGEPGLDEVDIPTADGLAELFVSKLLGELPDGIHAPEGQRVTAVLNGLGAVKYEELFVVYNRVNELLTDAGVDVIGPVVGEVCTSFDMAGASLTLTWLDDELEPLWTAPADAPAFRVGAVESAPITTGPGIAEPVVTPTALAPTSEESRAAAARVVQLLEAVRACVDEHADELGRIDSVAGDGDHGIGMQRGSKAAAAAAHEAYAAGAGAGTVLTSAADAWADRAGGTSGALWGVALRRLGARIGDQDKPGAAAIAEGVHAARTGICDFGGAELGDKTLIDVLVPFDEHLTAAVQQGSSLTDAMQTATVAAGQAAAATTHLLPRRGRARPHAERSLGTPDPGAVSLSLIVRTIHDNLAPRPGSDIPTSEGR